MMRENSVSNSSNVVRYGFSATPPCAGADPPFHKVGCNQGPSLQWCLHLLLPESPPCPSRQTMLQEQQPGSYFKFLHQVTNFPFLPWAAAHSLPSLSPPIPYLPLLLSLTVPSWQWGKEGASELLLSCSNGIAHRARLGQRQLWWQ